MSTLFWTIVLWVAGCNWNQLHGTNAQLVCKWVTTAKSMISGGKYVFATDVLQCQQICSGIAYCKGVDWDSANHCWLHNTTAGQKATNDVTHYDYVCTANPCNPNPCQNGGQCAQGATQGAFICTCINGWTGPTCGTPPDPCRYSPCKNGGQCSVGSSFNLYVCACANGFSGANCEIPPPDPCRYSPCKNGGKCSVASSFNQYECNCPIGFSGPTCETPEFLPENPTAAEPEEPDCRTREIVRRPSAMPCIETNYPGRDMDIYAKSDGFSWDYKLPRFEFDWPADISGRRITRMFYGTQTNLDSYGTIIIHGNNQRFESKKVHGDLTFEIITQIRKVIVYFEPLNLEEPLTVTGFNIRHCTVTGVCEPKEIFSRIKDVTVSHQGLVKNEPQIRANGLHWETSMTLPYVIVNVACLGYGAPEIRRIGISGIDDYYRTHVLVFKNNVRVPTINRLGQLTEYFNFHPPSATNVNSMRFKFKTVYGDRIRVTFIPPKSKVKGDDVHIWWKSFLTVICI